MKKFALGFCLIACLLCLTGCNLFAVESVKNNISSEQYFRIHIRANSNLEEDQNVKYQVKDAVVEYLTPLITECENKTEVISIVNNNLINLEQVANKVLEKNNKSYKAHAKVREEYFPTRAYGDYVLSADFYDALIMELGNSSGDNWWCVVYPPLCFINGKEIDSNQIKYKSKIMEIINGFFK